MSRLDEWDKKEGFELLVREKPGKCATGQGRKRE